jgi:hypothetical protein
VAHARRGGRAAARCGSRWAHRHRRRWTYPRSPLEPQGLIDAIEARRDRQAASERMGGFLRCSQGYDRSSVTLRSLKNGFRTG